MVIFSKVALKSKITCATANHQKIFETLSSRIKMCNAGMSVTYGPLCITGCSPKTRTLNCTVIPSSYAHPHPADSLLISCIEKRKIVLKVAMTIK